MNLTVSSDMMKRYLREELKLRYKRLKPITTTHNLLPAKLQR